MLADIQALILSGTDLNAQDDNGATLVRQKDKDCISMAAKRFQ